MAQVLGQSGRYVSQQAGELRRRILIRIIAVIALLGVVEGLFLSRYFRPWELPPLVFGLLAFVTLPLIWWFGRETERRLDILESQRRNMERGLIGESQVARILTRLPDTFYVINDLTTPFGNLDHVVVGPTGVFIIDAKNWRGLVTADGKGELLQNGRHTDKPLIKLFVGRVMSVRDKVRTLAPGLDTFFEALFVFTAARVEARWRTTGNVNCLTDDQLHDYIANKDFGRKLASDQVQRISQAFLGLATMDREFRPQPLAVLPKPVSPTPTLTSTPPHPRIAKPNSLGRLPTRPRPTLSRV